MTELEDAFKSKEKIAYEALAIALEKSQTKVQELERQIESYKEVFRMIQKWDLSPAKKEDNGMDVFKENKK